VFCMARYCCTVCQIELNILIGIRLRYRSS